MRVHVPVAAVMCLTSCLVPALAQEVSPQFRQMDANGDGRLTRDEFAGPLFDQIDVDKDGVITAAEDSAFLAGRGGAGQRGPSRGGPARGQMAGRGPAVPDSVTVERDLAYAVTDNPRQKLDLYLPKTRSGDRPLPVVVFIHGGAWLGGDKRDGAGTVIPLVASGDYAGVSVGYRLSGEAIWPAQIHDCKAAIRWLRANAKKYNLDPDRIGVTGPSAGGHLVAMLGTGGGVAELEGTLGEHLSESSRVQCVVDQFGPADLLSMSGWHDEANSPEAQLIGGPVQARPDAARNASPTTFVSGDDPPFLLIHGTADPLVPFNQSERLHEALQKAGVSSVLIPVPGAGHGGFPPNELAARLQAFFDKHLRGQDVAISTEPLTGPAAGR